MKNKKRSVTDVHLRHLRETNDYISQATPYFTIKKIYILKKKELNLNSQIYKLNICNGLIHRTSIWVIDANNAPERDEHRDYSDNGTH